MLDEVANEQMELASNGWTKTGSEKVTSVEVLSSDPAGTPPSAVLAVCVDSSEVDILDSSGQPIASGSTAHERSINIYTLHLIDGSWRVAARTFPDNPAC